MTRPARLSPQVLRVFGRKKVELSLAEQRIIFDISDATSLEQLAGAGPDVSAIAEASNLSADDAQSLALALHAAGFLDDIGLSEQNFPDGVSLADALLRPHLLTSKASHVIVTASEALAIPLGTPPSVVRQALRMFVSRLDDTRLMAYGPVASGSPGHLVAGDEPPAASLASLSPRLQSAAWPDAAVRTYSLTPESDEATGFLEHAETSPSLGRGRLAVAEILGTTEYPKLSLVLADGMQALPNLAYARPFQREAPSRWCGGVATDEAGAVLRCEAEGIERFVLGDVRPQELRHCAADALNSTWLDPREVVQYSPAQRQRLGLEEFDPGKAEWWVRGARAADDVWIPAALVFCPFGPGATWLAPGHSSSNGGAAGVDPDSARRAAWLELLERDAFWRTWLSDTAPPRLDPVALQASDAAERDAQSAQALIESMTNSGFAVDLLPVLQSATPIWIAVANNGARLVLGASAGADSWVVMRKALTEAWLQSTRSRQSEPPAEVEVRTPGDHGHFFSTRGAATRGQWLQTGPYVPLPTRWSTVVSVAAPATVAFYTRQYANWWVARAIDPGLLPLSFGYDQEPTGRKDFSELIADPSDRPLAVHPFA